MGKFAAKPELFGYGNWAPSPNFSGPEQARAWRKPDALGLVRVTCTALIGKSSNAWQIKMDHYMDLGR
jgi:hypothetical protein